MAVASASTPSFHTAQKQIRPLICFFKGKGYFCDHKKHPMRKLILSLCGLASFCAASAQFTAGAAINYSKYFGDLNRSTTGAGVRLGYNTGRYEAALSFTNGFAITEQETTAVTSKANGAPKSVATEGKMRFKTIALMGHRTLIGNGTTAARVYIGFGAGFVMARYTESITESFDKTAYTAPAMENEKETGFTVNGLLGGEYKTGRPSVFVEAGMALPANHVNEAYVANVIPAHYILNTGVKFRLGGK